MTIAVYTDIHGNTPGLDAVHAGIDSLEHVDLEICLGDTVYGGPGTTEIVDRLRRRDIVFLRGNHDEAFEGFELILPTLPPEHHPAAATWNRWIANRLTEADVNFLSTAPLTHRFSLPNGDELLFCHSAPDSTTIMLIGPDALEADRDAVFTEIGADIVCIGHWHEPSVWRRGNLQIVCPGSVGLSPDGLCRWLVIQADERTVRYLPKVTPYDVAEFHRLADETDMPRELHPGATELPREIRRRDK